MSKSWFTASLFLQCLLVSSANGQVLNPSVVLNLNSEPIYRGISESANKQSASLNIDLPLSTKWLVGIGASSVLSGSNKQRDRSITSHVGYNHEVGNKIVLGGALVHRAFPGSIKEWDYSEIQASLRWKDNVGLTLVYSDNYYDHDTAALIAELDLFQPITASSYWLASLGSTQFDNAVISEYVYANLGLGWRKGPITAEVKYGYTARENVVLFGDVIESPKLLFSLTYFAW